MPAVKDENYYIVQGWMINRLKLKGIDVPIYAQIYSFSQNGESEYKGSLDYLAALSAVSVPTVKRSLERLEAMGYIEKTDRNSTEGKTNTYKAVSLEIVSAQLKGVGQNELPSQVKMNSPPGQNDLRGVGQNELPFLTCNNNINNNNSNNNSYIEKVSKKESRKEGSYKPSARVRESYDEIIAKYDLSDEVREAVGEFIRHCIVNGKTPTNKALYRILDALATYPVDRRCKALQGAIDRNLYTLKPLADKHYDMFGTGNNEREDYQAVMEDILKEYLGENADYVFKKIWEFIQHCRANGQRLTNSRLRKLCIKLKKQYRSSEVGAMRTALDKAINGGYYDIKDGEDWLAEEMRLNAAFGYNPLGEVADE